MTFLPGRRIQPDNGPSRRRGNQNNTRVAFTGSNVLCWISSITNRYKKLFALLALSAIEC